MVQDIHHYHSDALTAEEIPDVCTQHSPPTANLASGGPAAMQGAGLAPEHNCKTSRPRKMLNDREMNFNSVNVPVTRVIQGSGGFVSSQPSWSDKGNQGDPFMFQMPSMAQIPSQAATRPDFIGFSLQIQGGKLGIQ